MGLKRTSLQFSIFGYVVHYGCFTDNVGRPVAHLLRDAPIWPKRVVDAGMPTFDARNRNNYQSRITRKGSIELFLSEILDQTAFNHRHADEIVYSKALYA